MGLENAPTLRRDIARKPVASRSMLKQHMNEERRATLMPLFDPEHAMQIQALLPHGATTTLDGLHRRSDERRAGIGTGGGAR